MGKGGVAWVKRVRVKGVNSVGKGVSSVGKRVISVISDDIEGSKTI